MSDANRLRDDIDAGSTRDKVAFSDPAAAPLGTDDEAAGGAPAAERIVLGAGTAPRASAPGSGTDERGRAYDDKGVTVPGVSFTTAVIGLLVAVLGVAAVVGVAMG
ncbi:hypothetical protein KHC23_00970 [Ancylobacter dichloromethanicus]|uniref:Uncharacterized protein n=1 Tax=Ancylobacter dichloromethanicus TaxID=518825 RepID=A0A9W6JAJ7_9HYPH|nr:hypothetical protein [Ancylobacter dichloromethanicus]MBS7552231.1 hypothetical protein [Ancylobacter dichloromethanicus]GLK73966.1 hypothetical protein GCM10017643_40840 [Ancylobacter dichloromethanicus]